jgi:hypothetical protein
MPDEMTDDLPNEETDSPDFADQQNFYKVEKVDEGRHQGRSPAFRR